MYEAQRSQPPFSMSTNRLTRVLICSFNQYDGKLMGFSMFCVMSVLNICWFLGNVEEWLGKVEEGMFSNLRKLTKASIADFEKRPRTEWVTLHASQVI